MFYKNHSTISTIIDLSLFYFNSVLCPTNPCGSTLGLPRNYYFATTCTWVCNLKVVSHSSNVSQFNSLPPVKSTSVGVRASNSSASTWHSRLGHPHVKILSHIFNKMSMPKTNCTSTNLFCKHCILGKMTQLPFPTSYTKTTAPLQLVHNDVWGPAPVTAHNGTKYYVSFINDFSHFTWFFPLKHELEVLPTFIHFKSTIENLLSHKLKIIRTDCGGEYADTAFQKFRSTNGIFHQFSCPHTHQQNGVAERKHRRIVDTALALISQFL